MHYFIMASIAKNEHYVPQFILKNFTVGNGKQIYVFDKHDEKSFKTNIRNIAAETGFYNFNIKEFCGTGIAEAVY